MAKPLTEATNKDCTDVVIWTAVMQTAFDQLKNALSSEPELTGPNFDKEFTLHTNASDRSIGAVVTQSSNDRAKRLIAYYSKQLLLQGRTVFYSRERVPSNRQRDPTFQSIPGLPTSQHQLTMCA